MKDLNNIVVEVLTREHGAEMIKTFNKLGIDTDGLVGSISKEEGDELRFYGLIGEEKFTSYSLSQVKESNAKIITLDELRAMKEDKSEYPKLMYVGDDEHQLNSKKEKRYIFFETSNGYFGSCETPQKAKLCVLWKYAQDIEPEAPIEKEVIEIEIKHMDNILKNAIVKINGKECQLFEKFTGK